MRTFNIDTLEITGTGPITFTEGVSNSILQNVVVTDSPSITKMINAMQAVPRPPITGEYKRMIMAMHVYKNEGNTVDFYYGLDLSKKTYTKAHASGLNFKIQLSTRTNTIKLDKVTIDHNIVYGYAIEEKIDAMKCSTEEIQRCISKANKAIQNLFEKY